MVGPPILSYITYLSETHMAWHILLRWLVSVMLIFLRFNVQQELSNLKDF